MNAVSKELEIQRDYNEKKDTASSTQQLTVQLNKFARENNELKRKLDQMTEERNAAIRRENMAVRRATESHNQLESAKKKIKTMHRKCTTPVRGIPTITGMGVTKKRTMFTFLFLD